MQTNELKIVHGACPLDCPDTCATVTEVDPGSGRAVAFYGDKRHPVTQGWLCAKVRPFLDRVYHPDRVLYPLRRVGPKGSDAWERIGWEEAIAEIADRWKSLIAEYGAASILPYSYSGTLGFLQNMVAASRLFNRMGASGLERSICGAAAELVTEMTVGARWAPDVADIVHSRFILIWGHNPSSTSPHSVPFIRQAQRSGAKVVVIDPRRTRTARSADLHIQPNPSTDGALALGLMHVIFREELHDAAWLQANTVGWQELRERVGEYPPERVAEITGVPVETIIQLAREYATTKPSLLKFADGIQRHSNGGQTTRALCCLPAVIGQIGVRGGGLFYSAGSYGALSAEAIGHASECPPSPRIVNMVRIGAALTGEVADPPIKALYVFNANPVASSPNSGLTIQGLLREDLFTVVHELFMTDTARYADIILPATTQIEQVDLHKAYGHRNLQYNTPAIAPIGEAKSNWDVSRLLAEAMGYDEPWLHQTGEQVIAEILEGSRAENPLLEGITLERLQAEGTVPLNFDRQGDVPFADGRFPTPSGKLELYCQGMADLGLDPLPEYVEPAEYGGRGSGARDDGRLVLISGASHHFVSSSMANIPKLRGLEGKPFVEIHPDDAAERGIVNGDTVQLENDRGWCRLRAVVTEDVAAGVLIAPKGHWARLSPGERNVNWITPDALGDIAGQSTFHSNLVTIRPVDMTADGDADPVDRLVRV